MNYIHGEGYTDRHDLISCSEYWRAHWNVDQVYFRDSVSVTPGSKAKCYQDFLSWGNGEFRGIHKILLTTVKLKMKIHSAFYMVSLQYFQREHMWINSHQLKFIFPQAFPSHIERHDSCPSVIVKFHFRLPMNQKPKAKVIYSHQCFSPGIINLFFISFGREWVPLKLEPSSPDSSHEPHLGFT
jgi:hypothetical protein